MNAKHCIHSAHCVVTWVSMLRLTNMIWNTYFVKEGYGGAVYNLRKVSWYSGWNQCLKPNIYILCCADKITSLNVLLQS